MSKVNAINNKSAELTIDPGASGDSFVQFDINGTGEFRIGVDDDASDSFKISQGSALGSNDTFVITASGEITKPLQPTFFGEVGAAFLTNVTGDGTAFNVTYGQERFDLGGDFSSPTFIAPVTGKYLLNAFVLRNDLTSSHVDEEMYITTSNRVYKLFCNPYAQIFGGSDQWNGTKISILCDMDASDTATLYIDISGGTKVVDIGYYDGSTCRGTLNGSLIC